MFTSMYGNASDVRITEIYRHFNPLTTYTQRPFCGWPRDSVVSFRECFFRRRLQPVNCAIVSCVELLYVLSVSYVGHD